MPRFSKQVLSQHLRTQCDRQLALNLYTNDERKRMLGWPEEDKTRGQVLLLAKEGNRWQEQVIRNLSSTFGPAQIIGTQLEAVRLDSMVAYPAIAQNLGSIQENAWGRGYQRMLGNRNGASR